jgi:hypothetical protein
MKTPRTPEEWQHVVNLCKAWRNVHDARLYGLIHGGPVLDVERIDELLAQGKVLGITPQPALTEEMVIALL